MIVKRVWLEGYGNREYRREGYYLFGVILLYVRDIGEYERRKVVVTPLGRRRITKRGEP